MVGSGCGSVGRADAFETRGPRFDSSHRQNFIEHLFIINRIEKTKINKKRPGMEQFKKKLMAQILMYLSLFTTNICTLCSILVRYFDPYPDLSRWFKTDFLVPWLYNFYNRGTIWLGKRGLRSIQSSNYFCSYHRHWNISINKQLQALCHSTLLLNSVSRWFGEIAPLGQNFKTLWQFLRGFNICQAFEPTSLA